MTGKPFSKTRFDEGKHSTVPFSAVADNFVEAQKERRRRGVARAATVSEEEEKLTPEQEAATSRGGAPPIPEFKKRKGAQLGTGGGSLG
jgi:hypothetical protein